MKKLHAGILVILLIALGLFLWLRVPKKIEQPISAQTLKIGLNPWIGNGIYYVAKEKGFFDAEKINVELEKFDDSAIGRQLLNTDKIDVLPFTPETAVILADAGVKMKIIGISDSSQGADGIVASNNIKGIADLKGKTVAFETGSPSHFLLSYLLNEKGLATNDLTVVNTIAPDAGAAFVAGKVDAAVTWEPWLSKASERQGGHLLVSSKAMSVFPDYLIFREKFVKNHPQGIRGFLRAFFAARNYILVNQDEAIKIIAKNFTITEQEVKDQLPTFKWMSYEDNLSLLAPEQGDARMLIQSASDLWFKLGLIKTQSKADDLITRITLGKVCYNRAIIS